MTLRSRFFRPLRILAISGCVSGMTAFAINVRGNGGDVLLGCENISYNGIILDYFEAESLLGLQIDLGSTALSPEQIAISALSRIPSFDSERRERLTVWATEFMSDTVFAPGIQLKRIDDSNELGIPKQCRLEQAAVQEEPRFPEAKRYVVSKDVWDLMDKKNQAGLILHEVIYREALSYGHTDSIRTRYFNSLVSSGKIATISQVAYNETMRYSGFPTGCVDFYDRSTIETSICFVYGTVSKLDYHQTRGLLPSPLKLKVGRESGGRWRDLFATFQNLVTVSYRGEVSEGTLAQPFQNVDAGHRVEFYRDYQGYLTGLKDLGPDPSL